MKEFTIGKNDAGQRLDRWVAKAVPLLPASLAQKYIRIKRIKLNGKGAKRDTRLNVGDCLQLYINDEFFEQPREDNAYLSVFTPKLTILYEDQDLILCDKRPGQLCHPDGTEYANTLITHIQAYLYQSKVWDPKQESSFTPALCNRIDRNTGGIVMAAKTAEAMRILNQKIKDREVEKKYLAVIQGRMTPPEGTLEHYLVRDQSKKQVTVHDRPVPGGKTAVTKYRTLAYADGLSLVECELKTGRTHQIRAQFAAAGHPLLGEGKYGRLKDSKAYGRTYQALYSYNLSFCFTTDAGILNRLNGQSWQVPRVDFVEEYFPAYAKTMHTQS